MKQLSVRFSLLGASALVLVVFMAALGVAVSGLNDARQRLADYLARDQVLLEAFSEMYAQGLQSGQAVRNIILDPANPKAYDNLAKARKDFSTALEQAVALSSDNADLAAALKDITRLAGQRDQQLGEISALAGKDVQAAQTQLNKQETPIWRKLKDILLEQKKQLAEVAHGSAEQTLTRVSEMRTWSLGLSVLAPIFGAGMMLLTLRGLYRRLGGEPSYAVELAHHSAVGMDAVEGALRPVQRQVHAADPEPPGGVGAAVVQPVAQGRVLDGGEGGQRARLGVEGVQRRAERDQEPAGAAQRQRPQIVGDEGPLGVAAGRGIVAVQPRPLDVDPPQGAAAGTPDRRFPQQVVRLHDAAQAVGGGGAGSGCRPA